MRALALARYKDEKTHQISRLVDLKELSAKINLKPHTIYQWISQRRVPFPYLKVGRRVMFDVCDVEAWIEATKIIPKEN